MASNPIQAGFAPADPENLPWLNEIGELLDHYQHAVRSLSYPDDSPISVAVKHAIATELRSDLARHGVTVCGGFGHA